MPRKDFDAPLIKPFISIIIPTYNHARFLPEAVASVRQQQYDPLEIIVVDDGSTDGTAEIVARLPKPIRYFRQSNKGPASARNKGLLAASGDFVAFLDADDLWPPRKLELQIAFLCRRPQLGPVLGKIRRIDTQEICESILGKDEALGGINLGSGLFRKSVFDKVGLFDETLRYSEDHDWFLRARENGVSMAILSETTLFYRVHGRNMTRAKEAQGFQLARVLKKSLDRRRLQNGGQVKSLPALSGFEDRLTRPR